jgi:hypothetical protein
VDQTEFNELYGSLVSALRTYVVEAETTSAILAHCSSEPMPLDERLQLMGQELIENTAHSTYLNLKRLLHHAALRGYGYSPN